MMTPIVVVAYNRAKSLARILKFISKGYYPNHEIPLIISIDKGDNADVIQVADDFNWEYGEKKVVCQPKNLGLRAHIIQCASLSEQYGSVIILEDDLLVSPNFYNYTQAALEFSANDDQIGGISLYNHQYNVHTSDPFYPMEDGYDNWYFQFASSWGEAWSVKQWKNFIRWYEENKEIDLASDNFPAYVAAWSPKSWLKYFIKYLVETDRYFIYPRISLSSNFSDKGEHAIGEDNTAFQVPMLMGKKTEYNFSALNESEAVYDAFYENVKLADSLNVSPVTVDLYGYKEKCSTRYLLTCKLLNHKIVKSYACSMRPHEANIAENLPGEDFFLYDMESEAKNTVDEKKLIVRRNKYKFKIVKRNQAKEVLMKQLTDDIGKLMRRIKH